MVSKKRRPWAAQTHFALSRFSPSATCELGALAKNLVHDSHDPSQWRHPFPAHAKRRALAPQTPISRRRPAESSRKLVLPPQRANSTLRAATRNISSPVIVTRPDRLLSYFVIIGERAGRASGRVETNAKVKVKEQSARRGLQRTLAGIN